MFHQPLVDFLGSFDGNSIILFDAGCRAINWTNPAVADLLVLMNTLLVGIPSGSIQILRNGARWGLLLALSLCLAGCKSKPNVAGVADPSGVYTLVSVAGKPVPASLAHDGTQLLVRAGTFTIRPDGTCISKITFVPPSGIESSREVSATYVRQGPRLEMKWTGAGITTGTLDGNEFAMNNEGMMFVYRR